jgi:DNA end-binding protein Ku
VESFDEGRGYEYSKNSFIVVEDEELDAIALESSHTLEIDKFVPREQIDERYIDSPYYMVPNEEVGQEAFAVIRALCRSSAPPMSFLWPWWPPSGVSPAPHA